MNDDWNPLTAEEVQQMKDEWSELPFEFEPLPHQIVIHDCKERGCHAAVVVEK